jgi:hypothetical protein
MPFYRSKKDSDIVEFFGVPPDPMYWDLIIDEQPPSALSNQIGGTHYKDFKIQPAQFFFANNTPYLEGSACLYILRWRKKNGIEDLRKAIHTIEMLIEMEEK